MRLSLNLASRPYTNVAAILKQLRLGILLLLLIALGVGFALFKVHASAEIARAQQNAVDQKITKLNNEQNGYQMMMNQPENAGVLHEAKFLNGLIDQKAFSWTSAMEDLGKVLPAGLQVTSINPDRTQTPGVVTLRLHVQGPRERAIDLVSNFEKTERFITPRISSESSESANGTNPNLVAVNGIPLKVTFEISTEYDPSKPPVKTEGLKINYSSNTENGQIRRTNAPMPQIPQQIAPARPNQNRPGMNQPGMNQPGMNQPGMNQQNMNHPNMYQPGGMRTQNQFNNPNMPGRQFPPGMTRPGMNQYQYQNPNQGGPQ